MEEVQTQSKAKAPREASAGQIGEIALVVTLLAILAAHYLHVDNVATEGTTVWAAAFSREDDRVAIASEVGNAVFDVERGEVEYVIDGKVSALTYSHDGRVLAVGGFDGGVRLLEATTGTEIRSLEGLTARIGRIRFSADDRKLVAIGFDEYFAVWEIPVGNRVCRIEAGESHRYAVDFAYGSSQVVTGGGSGDTKTHCFKFWSIESGLVTKTWKGPEHCYVEDIAVSEDGRNLVSGLSIPTLRVWDIESQKETAVFKAQAHDGLKLSQDETQLLATHHGGVDLCDLKSGTVRSLKVVGSAEAATFADDGSIVTLDGVGNVARWNPVTGEQFGRTEGLTLRTPPLNIPVMLLLLVWLLAWILWRLARGVESLSAPVTLFLPAYAALFVYTGYLTARAHSHPWSGDLISGHGGMLLLFVCACFAGVVAYGWSCQDPSRRRPLPMFACIAIALGGMAIHGMGLVHSMASAG